MPPMPESKFRPLQSPSPNLGGSVLPPLSKFYYGPAQGWTSTESSPSHNGSTWNLNRSQEISPALPPRLSPGPTAYTSRMNAYPQLDELAQGWHSSSPQFSPSHFPNIPYNPNSYAVGSGVSHSPVDATWDSDPSDTSSWGINHRHKQAQAVEPSSKPQLPPRPPQQPERQNSHSSKTSYGSKTPTSRMSATTIEVPFFLQPVAYDPATAPPLPARPQSPAQDRQSPMKSPPEPSRIPPPPPQKIPLDYAETPSSPMVPQQRPRYDPQSSYDNSQRRSPLKSRRPQFDPQNSHETINNVYQRSDQEDQPKIAPQEFTTFNVESALPPIQPREEPAILPGQMPLPPKLGSNGRERDLYHEHLHQSSISTAGPSDADRWVPGPKPWQQQAAYVPSPEQQHVNLVPHDGRSISTTDLSSNTAGKSTPDSHQTSNTSYHESEHQMDQPRDSQEGDGSFYWHSGRSSSDAEDTQSHGGLPAATSGERSSATTSTVQPREQQDLPPRSTSLSPVMSAPYGASALGFGGPSDWEYFGDYEAEEIDDEELYSRPKVRDSTSVKEGSSELPANPGLLNDLPDYSKPAPTHHDLPDYSESEGTSRTIPITPKKMPTGQSEDKVSHDDITQEMKTPTKGEYAIEGKLVSAQGHDHELAATSDAVAPSDASPDPRPDLDEVIRAWSQAPYVGLVPDTADTPLGYNDSNSEPLDVAEASLASTPRERMLGVDVILKNAPSVPKLPVSLDQLHACDNQPGRGDSIPMPPTEPTLTSEDSSEQSIPSLEKPRFVDIDAAANTEEVPSEEMTDHPNQTQSEPLPQNIAPLVMDGTISSKLVDTGLLGLGISNHQLDDSVNANVDDRSATTEATTKASKAVMAATKSVKNSSVLQRVKELEKKRSEASFHARSKDLALEDRARDSPGTSQVATPETSRVSTPQHDARESLEDFNLRDVDSTVSVAPKEISREDAPGALMESASMGTIFDVPPDIPGDAPQIQSQMDQSEILRGPELIDPVNSSDGAAWEASREEVRNEEDLVPGPEHSYENLKTPDIDRIPDVQSTSDVQALEADTTAGLPRSDVPKHSPVINTLDQKPSPKAEKTNDPYADLDAWGKASLNRFAAMLREESRAESNKDRLNLFNVFTSRESRLRVVLYGTEDDLIISSRVAEQKPEQKPEVKSEPEKYDSEKGDAVKPAVERTNTVNLQRSLKALPALPANRESVIGLPENALAPLVIEDTPKPKTEEGALTHTAGDDTYVMVEPPSDGPQYSPGGRPITARLLNQDRHAASSSVIDHPDSIKLSSSARNTVIKAEKPLYAHAKASEGRSEVKNYLANRKSVVRPYATLTQGSLDSGSTFGKASDSKLSSIPHIPTMAPTSQYNPSSQSRVENALDVTAASKAPGAIVPNDMRRFVKADFDPLLTVLPDLEAVVQESHRLEDLKDLIEAVPDDFTFIHQSVVSWDAKAKKQREENDRQRHARQVESEQRIDSLFDDHEIGYGDISDLEADFKQSEAARRADEDRSEYQTFVADVFNIVWTRLHYELDQLIPHYEQYSKLMNHTLAGKDMFEESKDGLPLAPMMSAFLGLHQKLEIRHQKAFEAVLERDRRLKKTEMAPWYTLSNIAKVKQLEKQFENAEKKAIIEYCQQRDTRANRLMDVLDPITLRGVGANQDYMEAIMKAVRRIASGRAFASVAGSNEPTAGMEEVEKAKAITTLLATSSEQIVQTFHVADMLLNSADYEVSVAKAKIARADMATLAKLKEERAKEDQKLMRDLEHRLALIREDSRRTNDEIVKLMLFLGVHNGRAGSTALQAGPADPDHETRIHKALEEAKIRNALKESSM